MKNSRIKYIILAILVLVISFTAFYFIKTPLSLDSLKKELTSAEELKLQQQVGDIIKTKDFNKCDSVIDKTYKKVCVNNIALNLAQETKDISYCQKIDNELVPIRDCESRVIFTKSLEKEDIAVCQETKDQELQKYCTDSFYPQLALKKQDIKICEKASPQDRIVFCRNNFLIQSEFMKNSKIFNCSSLDGADVEADCQKMKELSVRDGVNPVGIPGMPRIKNFRFCNELKTTLFSNYCLMNSGMR